MEVSVPTLIYASVNLNSQNINISNIDTVFTSTINSSKISATDIITTDLTVTNLTTGSLTTENLTYSGRTYGFVTGNFNQTIPLRSDVLLGTYWNGTPVLNGSISFSGGIFTILKSGFYNIIVNPIFNAPTGFIRLFISINNAIYGTQGALGYSMTDSLGRSYPYMSLISCITVNLNYGDTISIYIYNGLGTLSIATGFNGTFEVCEI